MDAPEPVSFARRLTDTRALKSKIMATFTTYPYTTYIALIYSLFHWIPEESLISDHIYAKWISFQSHRKLPKSHSLASLTGDSMKQILHSCGLYYDPRILPEPNSILWPIMGFATDSHRNNSTPDSPRPTIANQELS